MDYRVLLHPVALNPILCVPTKGIKMASPVFTRNENFNPQQGHFPPALNGNHGDSVMTLENTLQKTVMMFAVLLVAAAVGWFVPALALPGAIIALVLGLVISFKKEPSPVLIMIFAVAEGAMVGGFSSILEAKNPNIASQALLGTACVVAVVLFLYKTGLVRQSARATKIFMVAMISYFIFSLVNFGLILTGVSDDPWGLRGSVEIFGIPLGLLLGVLAVVMGAYSLIMDFTFIEQGAANRLPEKYGWTASFGLVVTVVWLYVEILRIIAIARR